MAQSKMLVPSLRTICALLSTLVRQVFLRSCTICVSDMSPTRKSENFTSALDVITLKIGLSCDCITNLIFKFGKFSPQYTLNAIAVVYGLFHFNLVCNVAIGTCFFTDALGMIQILQR